MQQPTQPPVAAFRGGASPWGSKRFTCKGTLPLSRLAEAVKVTMRNKVGSGKTNNLFIYVFIYLFVESINKSFLTQTTVTTPYYVQPLLAKDVQTSFDTFLNV